MNSVYTCFLGLKKKMSKQRNVDQGERFFGRKGACWKHPRAEARCDQNSIPNRVHDPPQKAQAFKRGVPALLNGAKRHHWSSCGWDRSCGPILHHRRPLWAVGFFVVHTRRVRPIGLGSHLSGMVQPHLWHGRSCANRESMENTGNNVAPSGGVWACLPRSHPNHPMDGHGWGGPGTSRTFGGADRFLSLDERPLCVAHHQRTVGG